MNMFARFDEIPAMTVQDIKETKRYGQTYGQRSHIAAILSKISCLEPNPACICLMCLHCNGKVSNCSIKRAI